ncbi:MAG: hypothetical protein K2M36_01105, partial [Clostridia bacterium]|nr:hypothetical protein [Clostridia bacterium]
MAQIYDFQLSVKQYVDLALEKHRKGDNVSAARYARKAISKDSKYLPAYSVLSLLYAEENEYELSNKTLFAGMNASGKWEDPMVRRQLAHNYAQLEMFDVAMYYADNVDAELYDALERASADFGEGTPDFYLSYPRGDEYYERLIARAFESAHRGDTENALQILDELGSSDAAGEQASQAKLILYTMKNDADGVIAFGEELIKKNSANAAVRCTLASAYVLKGRDKEAREVSAPLFELENPDIETTFILLPVAINLNMHSEVVRLINHAKKKGAHNIMRLMLWF